MKSKMSVGAVVAAVGGLLLGIGSFMTWASASINTQAFSSALGIDVTKIPGFSALPLSNSVTGWKAGDGRFTLVCGIVALVLGLVVLLSGKAVKAAGGLSLAAGLIGGGVALYDISQKSSNVADAEAPIARLLTLAGKDPSGAASILNVSLGIGIYICLIGGLAALIGGIMLLVQKSAAPAMPGGLGASGAGAGEPGGFGMPSSAEPPAPPVAPLAEPPSQPAASEPPTAMPPPETPPA